MLGRLSASLSGAPLFIPLVYPGLNGLAPRSQTLQRRNGLCFPNKVELGSEARTLDGLAWALPQAVAAPSLLGLLAACEAGCGASPGNLGPGPGEAQVMCGQEDWTPLKWLTPCASRLPSRGHFMSVHEFAQRWFIQGLYFASAGI